MTHAFLIMAHTNYSLLSRIIKKIDHPDNTIFIHIDAKSTLRNSDIEMLKKACLFSKIHFIERYSITWGGYSMINLELRLLEAATRKGFDYYHLLSGSDFLTKSMDRFHEFFIEHNGYEFVEFWPDKSFQTIFGRIAQYHFFRDICGRNKKNPLYWLNCGLARFQRHILRINRLRKYPDIQFKWGSNWCSITHNFATYLLSKESQIRKVFSYTNCADEIFLQTILFSSPFSENIYGTNFSLNGSEACLRSIDWTRSGAAYASPYVYTVSDYEELINSNNMFCRKVTDQTPEGEALIQKLENIGT